MRILIIGGNGTIVGASANVISVDIAKKKGVEIKFNPKTYTIHEIAELLSPAVTPR